MTIYDVRTLEDDAGNVIFEKGTDYFFMFPTPVGLPVKVWLSAASREDAFEQLKDRAEVARTTLNGAVARMTARQRVRIQQPRSQGEAQAMMMVDTQEVLKEVAQALGKPKG